MPQSRCMLVVAEVVSLVIASSFLSSAQRSPQCTTAIIALFHNDSANACENAYLASVEFGNATDLQKSMVCDADQQCNSMIEDIISLCGDKVESPTRFDQDLSCATGLNGTNCFFAYNDFISNGGLDILGVVVRSCFSCNQACAENLLLMNETLGCCSAEIFQALSNRGSVADASIFTNAYPQLCGFGTFALCNGDTLPSTPCAVASIDLVNTNDECSRTIESLFTGISGEFTRLYSGDCPTRLLNYASVCSNAHGEGFLQFAQSVFATSQARSSNGRRCSEYIEQRSSMEDGMELTCIADFFQRKCSSACRQGLANPTAEFGCCFNTFVAEFNGRSTDIPSQIEYAILTRDIYDLCEIDSAGFCTGTSPPSYTNVTEQCIGVANSFSANDDCLEHYYALGVRSSATAVNNAAIAICANEMCTSHMSSYINYLLTCQVVNIDEDDYDEFYVGDEENDKYLGLANVIGNTTCKADRNNTSCYFSILSSPMYSEISRAFDVGYSFAACAEVITDSTCLLWCKQFLTEATESLGCCFVEYVRAVIGVEGIQNITTLCESDVLLGTGCSEIQDINIAGSASTATQKALGVLLLEMITVILITCFY